MNYDEVMNPRKPHHLFTNNLCRLAIPLLLQVRRSPLWACSHGNAQEPQEQQRGNRASTDQQSYVLVLHMWKRMGSNSSSVSALHPHHISDFSTCLFGIVRTKFGFLWKSRNEVPLETQSKETGKNHRMGNTGRDHWRWTSPTSPFKQGLPEHITQECVQNEKGSL